VWPNLRRKQNSSTLMIVTIELSGKKMNYLHQELIQKLQEDQRIFDFLCEGSLDGVWYWDLTDNENEWMSPEFWKTLGYDPNTREHKASEWQDLIFAEDLETANILMQESINNPDRPCYQQVVRYHHADGGTVYIRCRGYVVRDNDGNPIRILGAHNDLTKEYQLNNRLQRQCDDLKQLAYSISHDLRAPLRAICGYLGFLESSLQSPEDQEIYKKIIASSERLSGLLDFLVSYSRIDLLDSVETSESVDLGDIIADAITDLDMKCCASISFSRKILVDSNRSILYSVFSNILDNAKKYQSPDRKLVVSVDIKKERNFVILSFTDNGIGVREKDKEKVFQILQRLHHRSSIPGDGMGLALSRKKIELLGGSIDFISTYDEGSTFFVKIPIV